MIIDSHSHLNFQAFNQDREEVIKKCLKKDLLTINVGSNYLTSCQAVKMARKGVYASVGLHPIHVEKEEFKFKKFKELALNDYVVAVGETGFDFLRNKNVKKQKEVFFQHLKLAEELNLPLIIHCRKAHDELLEILPDKVFGVVHCFTGSLSQAKKYLEKGLFLGFTGIIFKLNLDRVIKEIPLERMLVETDCPYLGDKERNDPFFVEKVIERIDEIKRSSEVGKVTFQNAKKLFSI